LGKFIPAFNPVSAEVYQNTLFVVLRRVLMRSFFAESLEK
jgi:hypothetical protein